MTSTFKLELSLTVGLLPESDNAHGYLLLDCESTETGPVAIPMFTHAACELIGARAAEIMVAASDRAAEMQQVDDDAHGSGLMKSRLAEPLTLKLACVTRNA